MKDWRSLGTAHRRRDDTAASVAQTQGDLHDSRATTALARWPGIVRAITTAAAAYNAGVGREVVVLTETTDRQHPSVTLESVDGSIPPLIVTLDDAELNVGGRATDAATAGIKRWVDLTRTDDETAAYVLQEWMERL